MKQIKEMMKGLKRKEYATSNGKVTIVKELAHYFDEELEEHFFYIYKVEEIKNNEYKEYYL